MLQDCVIIKSYNDLNYFYTIANLIFMERFGIKKSMIFKDNKIYVKRRYIDLFSRIMSEYLVREYIFMVTEELFSNNEIETYTSDDSIVKIIFKLTEYDLSSIVEDISNKIIYFANKEDRVCLDGVMLFCLNEFKYELFQTIEYCLNEV